MNSDDVPLGITLPDDMPISQAAMLQVTLVEAWKDYDGDPNNAEEFWNFLTRDA